MSDFAAELALATDAARGAGAIQLDRYERLERIVHKGPRDVVTEVAGEGTDVVLSTGPLVRGPWTAEYDESVLAATLDFSQEISGPLRAFGRARWADGTGDLPYEQVDAALGLGWRFVPSTELRAEARVLKLGRTLGRLEWRQEDDRMHVRAGAAAPFKKLVVDAVGRDLTGLEFAEGIPGSIGGGGVSYERRQIMNCSSPYSASVAALSLPCSAP